MPDGFVVHKRLRLLTHRGGEVPRIAGMTNLEDSLSRAHALVARASFSGGDDFADAALRARCADVAQLLEDVGAQPDPDELGEPLLSSALPLLLEAERLLDAIAADERPLRLSSVRAELAGARAHCQSAS